MSVESDKILALITFYGEMKEFPEKSYIVRFTEDHNLNYKQWNAYAKGTQNIGIKIIQELMYIFPNLNLNYIFKEDENMFVDSIDKGNMVNESSGKYVKNVTNEAIFKKLEQIHFDVLKVK